MLPTKTCSGMADRSLRCGAILPSTSTTRLPSASPSGRLCMWASVTLSEPAAICIWHTCCSQWSVCVCKELAAWVIASDHKEMQVGQVSACLHIRRGQAASRHSHSAALQSRVCVICRLSGGCRVHGGVPGSGWWLCSIYGCSAHQLIRLTNLEGAPQDGGDVCEAVRLVASGGHSLRLQGLQVAVLHLSQPAAGSAAGCDAVACLALQPVASANSLLFIWQIAQAQAVVYGLCSLLLAQAVRCCKSSELSVLPHISLVASSGQLTAQCTVLMLLIRSKSLAWWFVPGRLTTYWLLAGEL